MKDLHDFWGHRWLTPKAKIFKSKIFHHGPFAVKKIKKDELIRVTGGLVVPKKDIQKYRRYFGFAADVQVNERFFLAPSSIAETKKTGTFNHSCNPNVGFLDPISIVAMHDIEPGEELTMEYACFGGSFKPFKCKCGSADCRKTIRANDWKIPEIQKKYGKYFSPYLKNKLVS